MDMYVTRGKEVMKGRLFDFTSELQLLETMADIREEMIWGPLESKLDNYLINFDITGKHRLAGE